jgi:RNA polymerase sigma-70 factor (ECF subfamily)
VYRFGRRPAETAATVETPDTAVSGRLPTTGWGDTSDGTAPEQPAGTPSFEEVYLSERGRLVGLLTAMGGNRALAEDVAQDAFARAWARWERVRRSPSPAGWVYRTAFRMHRRRTRRADVVPGRREAHDAVDDAGIRLDLLAALRGLPRRQRQLIVLRHIGGLPTSEVAQLLGMREGAVRAGVHRAVVALRTALGDDPPPSSTDRPSHP